MCSHSQDIHCTNYFITVTLRLFDASSFFTLKTAVDKTALPQGPLSSRSVAFDHITLSSSADWSFTSGHKNVDVQISVFF